MPLRLGQVYINVGNPIWRYARCRGTPDVTGVLVYR